MELRHPRWQAAAASMMVVAFQDAVPPVAMRAEIDAAAIVRLREISAAQ